MLVIEWMTANDRLCVKVKQDEYIYEIEWHSNKRKNLTKLNGNKVPKKFYENRYRLDSLDNIR